MLKIMVFLMGISSVAGGIFWGCTSESKSALTQAILLVILGVILLGIRYLMEKDGAS